MIRPDHYFKAARVPFRVWMDQIGRWHRISGPAIEDSNGAKHWMWNGRLVRKESGEHPSDDEDCPHPNPAYYFPGYGPPDTPNPEPPSPGILVA
jgi:hypothetical protein